MTEPTAPAAMALDAEGPRVHQKHAAGCITLARPTLDAAARSTLAEAYPGFARDPVVYAVVIRAITPGVFSHGADQSELAHLARHDPDALCRTLAAQQYLSWLHECFSKPSAALMDGDVLGSGAGLCQFGTHRIAGERYAFGMPAIANPQTPSAGLSHVFSRMPGAIGIYLGLTGTTIGRADAFRLGLASHCVASSRFEEIETRLTDADPIDALIDPVHEDPGTGQLAAMEPVINRCFGRPSLDAIVAALEAERGSGEAWARESLAALNARPSLVLKASRRLIQEVASLDLPGALALEHRVACRLMLDARSSDQAQATEAMLAECFTPDPRFELRLPTRAQMQAQRV